METTPSYQELLLQTCFELSNEEVDRVKAVIHEVLMKLDHAHNIDILGILPKTECKINTHEPFAVDITHLTRRERVWLAIKGYAIVSYSKSITCEYQSGQETFCLLECFNPSVTNRINPLIMNGRNDTAQYQIFLPYGPTLNLAMIERFPNVHLHVQLCIHKDIVKKYCG